MYTLTKSKINASAHSRGPPRHLDSYENRDKSTVSSKYNKIEGSEELPVEMSNPKPIFQQRRTISTKRQQSTNSQDSTLQENHLEMVTFLSRQWQKVQENKNKEGENIYEIYKEKEPKRLIDSNFTPFDLESHWERKQLTVIGKSTS
ncbi:hypothetical protein Btru_036052 [Bulinus truncatus]|nr:hypothetical protein Btru_036052 [Bulinus truncatus]